MATTQNITNRSSVHTFQITPRAGTSKTAITKNLREAGYSVSADYTAQVTVGRTLGKKAIELAQDGLLVDLTARQKRATRKLRGAKSSESGLKRLIRKRNAELQKAVEQILLANYKMAAGTWAGGGNSFAVTINDTPSASGTSSRAWSSNGKWTGLDAAFAVHVQRYWLSRINTVTGLADAGGMLTTHAEAVASDAWKATWVKQGRGFELKTESGFIVRVGDQFFHGKTEVSARKVAAKQAQFARVSEKLRAVSLDQLVAEFGSLKVRVSDSTRAGNCKEGTEQWAAVHCDGCEELSVREIIALDSTNNRAISAIKAAILRQSK